MDVRGRWACRIFCGSGAVDALGAFRRGVEERARLDRVVREATVKGRPVPSRIRERADAIVEGNGRKTRSEGSGRPGDG